MKVPLSDFSSFSSVRQNVYSHFSNRRETLSRCQLAYHGIIMLPVQDWHPEVVMAFLSQLL